MHWRAKCCDCLCTARLCAGHARNTQSSFAGACLPTRLLARLLTLFCHALFILFVRRYTHAKHFATLLRCLREAVWPDGKLSEDVPWPGQKEVESKRMALRQRALRANLPVLTNILGVRASREGLLKLHAFLQSPVLTSSLLITVLDALLNELFEDMPVAWQTPGNEPPEPPDNSLFSVGGRYMVAGAHSIYGGGRGALGGLRQRVGSTITRMLPSKKK